uniref:Uncharacterized protein n=1 Tax=Triticum urartu TaxID=4572 RepID=A0A8R7K392_TRIUA
MRKEESLPIHLKGHDSLQFESLELLRYLVHPSSLEIDNVHALEAIHDEQHAAPLVCAQALHVLANRLMLRRS